ncbi:MAG: trimethylamine methyltransferase family protein [Rhodospirillales bacterium]|nr:MAG: trimethylamine methyltransferase family protein [Rhodospirillales bacterium]
MSQAGTTGRRRGGRAARQAARAAPLQVELRPVRPGMAGGWFVPLSDGDVRRIHESVIEVLETVGIADPVPSCVDAVTAAGGRMGSNGRLLFPRALVEDMVAKAARNFTLSAQDPAHDMILAGKNVHFGTAGAAVHMVDAVTGEYRDSTLADLYDIARLVERLDNIHFFQRPVTARDMTSGRALDINTLYACIAGTTKHVGTSFISPANVEEGLRMLHMVCGGEEAWRARPFVSMSSCFIVPPLRFAEDACGALEAGVHGGMPVLLLSAGQAGATSPAALAGAVVQQMAEVLAGIVYINALKPGHPAIIGPWPFVSDLRSGAMSGGSGEQALLSAACAQMAHFYDLPGGLPAGMTDSKVPDAQSGYEKGYTNAIVGVAGANLIYESAGMHASLLGCCLESFVIDNDILGAAMRIVRGIDVTDESLSVDVIRQVCIDGPGHFLGHGQTLSLMQREYFYPEVGDRTSPKEWKEIGSTDVVQKAHARVAEILSGHYPEHIDEAADRQLRDQFGIELPRAVMRPGNDRW